MKSTAVGLLLFLIFLIAIATWRYHSLRYPDADSVERTKILMDTLVRIEVFDENEDQATKAIEAAYDEIERLSQIFSHHIPESEVSRLNRNPAGKILEVSPELYTVLERSKYFSIMMRGAFDLTIGTISQLWNFTGENPKIPQVEEIQERLLFIDFRNIITDEERRVSLASSKIAIDLGGVAKGYSVDRAIEVLRENGISRALVDAGGDIGLLGMKANSQPWRIGVQHPRDATELIAIIEIDSESVATSGDYQRFFFQDGQRYHHILDPKTGWPSRECISVTIVTRRAMDADILATGIFVLGPERGMAFVEELAGVEGLIFFEKDGQIEHIISKGLRDRVRFH